MKNELGIRLTGFTDSWKTYKLGDVITEFYNGQTPYRGTSEYWNGDVNWLSSGDLNRGLVTKTTEKITEEGRKSANLQIVPKGTVVIAIMGLEAAGVRGNCGKLGIDTTINQACMALFPDEKYLTPDFLMQWYQFVGDRYGQIYTQGTKQQNYNAAILAELSIKLPSVPEQKEIGRILSTLDSEIILYQSKCAKLALIKKSMLQKMFPRHGENVPEIRFVGYTKDWEQCKLSDLVERVTRKNKELESDLPLTISAQYGLIDQNEFFDKRVASKDVSGYFLIKKGEFAYNKSTSNDAPWGAIKRLDRYDMGVLSTLYIVFRINDNRKTDSDFLATYYDTDLWHDGIQVIAAEGARSHGLLNIAPQDFFETTLYVPQDVEEQEEIGRFFKRINSLITLQQRKCERLKNIKSSLLSKMFV